jgi:hypothetical protein
LARAAELLDFSKGPGGYPHEYVLVFALHISTTMWFSVVAISFFIASSMVEACRAWPFTLAEEVGSFLVNRKAHTN